MDNYLIATIELVCSTSWRWYHTSLQCSISIELLYLTSLGHLLDACCLLQLSTEIYRGVYFKTGHIYASSFYLSSEGQVITGHKCRDYMGHRNLLQYINSNRQQRQYNSFMVSLVRSRFIIAQLLRQIQHNFSEGAIKKNCHYGIGLQIAYFCQYIDSTSRYLSKSLSITQNIVP